MSNKIKIGENYMKIPKNLIDITHNDNAGYHILMHYESWRVAVLNNKGLESIDDINYLEYHSLTDEVFILSKGKGTLILADGENKPKKYYSIDMEIMKSYNVKKNTWHAILLDDDSSIIIIENHNTDMDNSIYYSINGEERVKIKKAIMEQNYEN